MENNYALVVTANSAYLPALNAMLNALDYYGNKEIDVHILYDRDIEWYVNSVKNKFIFTIVPACIDKVKEEDKTNYYNYIWAKYKYANDLRTYESVLHLDCDALVVGNLEKYFLINSYVKIILCAKFPHTGVTIESFDDKRGVENIGQCLSMEDWVICNYPLANFPIFYDPNIHAHVMKAIYDQRPLESNSDAMRNHEMYFFNKVMYETGVYKDILELPGNIWVSDTYNVSKPLWGGYVAGKYRVVNCAGDTLMVLHNKVWKDGFKEAELARTDEEYRPATINNFIVIEKLYEIFNKEWKVKL